MTKTQTGNSRESLKYSNTFFDLLTADLALCENKLDGGDHQFWRRSYVRIYFTMIEGLCALMREKCLPLACTQDSKGGISVSDIHFLSDVGFRIKDNGTLEPEEHRCPFINRVAFSIRTFAKYANVTIDMCGDSGWKGFRDATKIRNRLTHPKSAEDLTISDEDMKVVQSGVNWFYTNVVEVMHRTDKLKSDAPLPPRIGKRE
jgi:hypothetical protein